MQHDLCDRPLVAPAPLKSQQLDPKNLGKAVHAASHLHLTNAESSVFATGLSAQLDLDRPLMQDLIAEEPIWQMIVVVASPSASMTGLPRD